MKLIQTVLPVAIFAILSSCSSTQHSASAPDDVYYSAGDQQPAPAPAVSQPAPSDYDQNNTSQSDQSSDYYRDNSQPDRTSSSQQTGENGTTYVTNNYYYDEDDYYDYAYSARLKRYYAPAYGYGYYDPFYTNSYWYDYNPYHYGVSIYLGYRWWAPSHCYYNPFWYGPSWSSGYGYYDPWHSPYYSHYPYYGYNNYWSGYNHGYNHGYWDGYYSGYQNPYYYNSYDGTSSVYYGPRGSVTSNGKTSSPSPRATLAEKYERAVAENNPIVAPSGKAGAITPRPVSGRDGGASSGAVQPVKDKNATGIAPRDKEVSPVTSQPGKGTISIKNETGGKNPVRPGEVSPVPENNGRPAEPSSYSMPGKTNTEGINQQPGKNGGNTRPNVEQPSRGNQYSKPDNNSRPKNGVSVNPRNNAGGSVRPNVEQQPRNNNYSKPRNNDGRNKSNDNSIGQPRSNERPRNESVNPKSFESPKNTTPKMETPRNERPRQQEAQPRFEQRQEPRQYKQENAQPRKENAPSENKSGGKRK